MNYNYYGPSSGLHVYLMSKAEAERFDRRTHNVPDDHTLGWRPYTIIVQYRTLAHTAFVTMREFKRWLGRDFKLYITSGRKAFRSGVIIPAAGVGSRH